MSSDKKHQAVQVDREVRELVRKIETTWLSLGRLCERCRSEQLYLEIGFKRFDDWIRDAVGWSRSRAYVAMSAARELVPIRDADLTGITVQNAYILSRVPKSRQAALVKAAQTQTEQRFRETVQATVPGLHLEFSVHVEFWVPRSLAEVIERCVEKAKVLNQTDSRTDAIEAIFAEFDIRHPDPEKELEAECQAVTSPALLPPTRAGLRRNCEINGKRHRSHRGVEGNDRGSKETMPNRRS